MISVTFTLPMILMFGTLLVVIFALGFYTRVRIQQKLQARVLELENEMVNNHAEILQLTRHIALLQNNVNANTPVISLGNKDFNQKTAVK